VATGRSSWALAFASELLKFEAPRGVAPRTNQSINAPSRRTALTVTLTKELHSSEADSLLRQTLDSMRRDQASQRSTTDSTRLQIARWQPIPNSSHYARTRVLQR